MCISWDFDPNSAPKDTARVHIVITCNLQFFILFNFLFRSRSDHFSRDLLCSFTVPRWIFGAFGSRLLSIVLEYYRAREILIESTAKIVVIGKMRARKTSFIYAERKIFYYKCIHFRWNFRWFWLKECVHCVLSRFGWYAVNPLVFESVFQENIFFIGICSFLSSFVFFCLSCSAAANKNNRPNNRSDLNKFSLFMTKTKRWRKNKTKRSGMFLSLSSVLMFIL